MKVKVHVCGINTHVLHKDSLTVTVIGNVDGFFWAAGKWTEIEKKRGKCAKVPG